MSLQTHPWDPSDYIDSAEEYLKASLEAVQETGDLRIFHQALQDVAKAKTMTVLAEKTGLGRESLYKALKPGAKPRFETVNKIVNGLGLRLTIEPLPPKA